MSIANVNRGLGDGEAVRDLVAEDDGVVVADGEVEADSEAVGEGDGETEDVRDAEGDGDTEAEGEGERLAETPHTPVGTKTATSVGWNKPERMTSETRGVVP